MTYKTKILVVDDRPANITALTHLISKPDVEILSATSGNDALALILNHDFALALIDVQMPVISGLELARLMRGADRSKNIPIIFVTASQRSYSDIFDGYDKGAVDYLLKPLDPHMVRSKVRVFVELDHKTRQLQQKLQEVEALKDIAEAANEAKSRFLANMSHEIRTPLGAVLGFSELLNMSSEKLDEEQLHSVSSIIRNGKQLLQLIESILDLSKIEADRIEIEKLPVSLSELVTDLNAAHAHVASEKGIKFSISFTGKVPKTIKSDPVRLRQILNNLIANAIKFTEKGHVNVLIGLTVHERASQKLSFTIEDTGCGLAQHEVDKIFQPFTQADSSTTRKFGGTGLGLGIARQLAVLLGGNVELVKSAPLQGSVFRATVDPGPLQAIELVQLVDDYKSSSIGDDASTKKGALSGIRILVVDDAPDNRKIIGRFLELAGAQVDLAADAAEGVHKALTNFYDVILMDIQMPGIDGYEAAHLLREKKYKRPIIALTAHAMKEELERCLNSGFSRYLSKPITLPGLVEGITQTLKE
jgi:signal transduction histidine kinase